MIFMTQVWISMSHSFFNTGNLFFFRLHFSMLHYKCKQTIRAIGFAGNVAFQYVLDYCSYAAIWKWPCKRGFALSGAWGPHNIFGWIITFRYAYKHTCCQYSKIWLQAICHWTMLTKIIVEELRCILKLLKIPQGDQYVPIAQNGWSTFYITCVDSSFRFKEGCFFSALCLQISEKDFSQAIKREHHFCEMDQTSSEKCRIYGETVDFTFYSPKGTID